MKRTPVLIFIALFLCISVAQAIPSEVKKSVAFIYTFEPGKKLTKGGTGFFIGEQTSQDRFAISLVTAKHVLQTDDGKSFLPEISLRLNTLDGNSDIFKVALKTTGAGQNVFVHPDSTVDLAVVTVLPDKTKYDFSFLESDLLTKKDDLDKMNISEGSDVFFTGLFIPFMGENKIYPLVRFGKIALIPDERVLVNGEKKEVYLIEAGAYSGSSGSPAFVNTEDAPDSRKLIGIISNHFVDKLPVRSAQTAPSTAIANIGIAIIEPAYKLQEILQGKEMQVTKLLGRETCSKNAAKNSSD